MVLTVVKWLIWLIAFGVLMLLVAAPFLVGASLEPTEVIVTVFAVCLISAPGFLIHYVQKLKETKRRYRSQPSVLTESSINQILSSLISSY